ncbi:MAG: J domain-containing protein, partial [Rhodospirillales bacterium]|nr:J domain-containing protein [Rhodospirillales bacterium]
MTSTNVLKHSYTVPCASTFREAVEALASKRKVNVGDLARSVLLMVPMQTIDGYADPGEPAPQDRETVILKSGPAEGRPWRRKPRLQVRMPPGYEIPFIRRALAIALAMDKGEVIVRLDDGHPPESPPSQPPPEIAEELERLRTIVSVLAFEPLPEGVR